MNIVVVGHVDHGKSTLIGRLLYDTKSLPLEAIERVKKISEEKGKVFEYAYLLDAFEEEQKQGITIDTTNIKFSSEKRNYTIIDAPGHKEFLKNMISGASNAEAALLIIDSNEGVQEQSKRHGFILSLLGIKKIFVIVNKMDLVNYSNVVFENIRDNFTSFLSEIGVFPLGFIPVSALNGENIVSLSKNLSWYKGGSVLESIDSITEGEGDNLKPFRLPIQDVYKFDSRRIIAGRIESGTLQVGDEVIVYPSLKETVVESIEGWRENKREKIYSPLSVGVTFRDEFFNKRGEIVGKKGEVSPYISNNFVASVFWMGKDSLVEGKKYKIKLVTNQVECEIIKINKVINTSTLDKLGERDFINRNEVGEVVFKTKDTVALDIFNQLSNTGRFVIVDGYNVSGGGIITEVRDYINQNEINLIKELKSEIDLEWAKKIFNRTDICDVKLTAIIKE